LTRPSSHKFYHWDQKPPFGNIPGAGNEYADFLLDHGPFLLSTYGAYAVRWVNPCLGISVELRSADLGKSTKSKIESFIGKKPQLGPRDCMTSGSCFDFLCKQNFKQDP
jgi:hypothetical protein